MSEGKRKDLAGRMQQAATRPAAVATEAPPAGAAPRAKPVRVSVDLAPTAYRRLIEFCHRSAETLGVARINGVDVLRALLVELNEDEDLATRVRTRLGRSS